MQQHPAHRVVAIEQTLQKTFNKPFGHGLARVLTGYQPDSLFLGKRGAAPGAGDAQQAHVASVQRAAQALLRHMGGLGRRGQQVQMQLVGIGLEVCKIHAISSRRGLGRHDLTIKHGGNAKPVLPVVAGYHLVASPPLGVGAGTGVQKAQRDRQARSAVQCEVKPLGKFAGVVGANVQLDIAVIVQAHHVDGAGIKLGGNVQCGHAMRAP